MKLGLFVLICLYSNLLDDSKVYELINDEISVVVVNTSLYPSQYTLQTEPTRVSPLSFLFYLLFSPHAYQLCVSAIFQHSVPKFRHTLGATSFTGR